MHGQFVWYELTTPDVDAAQKFYPHITGWGTQQFDKDYTMWTNAGVPFAGIFRLGEKERQRGIPPNWMPYIESNNVDKTTTLATSLGGKVMHGPDAIPGVGRFAVLQDPQGAVFGIYKSDRPSQSWDGTPVLGRFSWHELMTTDYPKAFDFYRTLFGWEKTGEMDMGGGNNYFMYGKGKMFGGMFNRPPEMASMHPFWLVYIHVKDVRTAVDVATRAGAFVQRGPEEIPGGMIAILGDPQGAGFAVHHMTAPAAAPQVKATGTSKPAAGSTSKAATSRPKTKTTAKRKSTSKKSASKKSTSRKVAARKSTSKRTASKKSASKKSASKKSASKRSTSRKSASKRSAPRKSRRGPAKKSRR